MTYPDTSWLDRATGVRPLAEVVEDPQAPFPSQATIRARAEELIQRLLGYYGYGARAARYSFGFDRAKRRIGSHLWNPYRMRGEITVSAAYARTIPAQALDDTLRHEVAHALDEARRGCSDHGPRWKECARLCGARAERCKTLPADQRPTPKWRLVCDTCGFETSRHRLSAGARTASCPKCSPHYDERYRLRIVQNH